MTDKNGQPPDTTAADDPLLGALGHLEGWAADWGVAEDPYVRGMLSGRIGQHETGGWVSHDPLEYLPHPDPTSMKVLRSAGLAHRLANGLAGLRNLLVFVPVAFTWWAIHEATSAFEAVRDTGPTVETSFLDVWVTGAGDSTVLWSIQRVAFVDALLIGTIVLLTLLAGALHSVTERSLITRRIAADRARTETGMLLALALEARKPTAEATQKAMTRLVRTITGAAHRLASASENLEHSASGTAAHMLSATEKLEQTTSSVTAAVAQTADQLHTVTADVAKLGSGLGAVETRLAHLADRVDAALADPLQRANQAITELTTTVSTLTSWLETDRTKYLKAFTESLSTVTAGIERAGTTLEFGTLRLREDLESLSDVIENLSEKASS